MSVRTQCTMLGRSTNRNGIEVQDLCNVLWGIMLLLKLVESAKEERARARKIGLSPEHNKLNKGTKVLHDQSKLWHHTGHTIMADEFFASVQATKKLKQTGFNFMGNVKSCFREFPMKFSMTVCCLSVGQERLRPPLMQTQARQDGGFFGWIATSYVLSCITVL
jgi:hypothetical protein